MTYSLNDHMKRMRQLAPVTERASTAIELCLPACYYFTGVQKDTDTSFMCNALILAYQEGAVAFMAKELALVVIQGVMEQMAPHKHFGTMSNCLREWASRQKHWYEPESEQPHLDWVFADEETRKPMMRQFYAWLVFDLKRKGW